MNKNRLTNRRDFLKIGSVLASGMVLSGMNIHSLFAASKSATASASLRFAVISDIHFENRTGLGAMVKVPKTLKNLLSKQPVADAVFVAGDLTNNGRADQYDLLLSVFKDTSIVPAELPVYFMMGNHDNFDKEGQANYLEKIKQPFHQFVDIKGYPFITISMSGGSSDSYNDEATKFLSESLETASKKYRDKPIFVFMHVPPLNTCYGSMKHEGWGTAFFSDILNKYPQIIIFAGHSHYPLGDPRSIHQDKFTSVNDGSVTYSEVEREIVTEGIHPRNNENITEGVIVNILPNGNVEMERWDTFRNEEILPRWVVEAPFDGTKFKYKNQNGLPAPVFAKGIKPSVEVNGRNCTVIFQQAKDNEAVHHYIVELLLDKKTIASISRFSQFYLNSETPPELSVNFYALPAGKNYVAQVTALDSYNNPSSAIKSNSFSINNL
jgi:Icc-related predicted phosphoesterase